MSLANKLSITDVDVKGKRVLIRVSLVFIFVGEGQQRRHHDWPSTPPNNPAMIIVMERWEQRPAGHDSKTRRIEALPTPIN